MNRKDSAEKIGRDTPELCVKMRELFAEQAKKIYQSTQLAAALAPKLQPDVKAEVEAEVEVDSAIAEVVKVADDDSAKGWGKRRSLGEGEEQLSTSLALVLAEEGEEQEKEETHAEPARLNLSAPYDVAKVFVIRNNGFIGKIEGELVRKPTLWFWQREFWAWNGCCYQMVEEDEVRAKVYDFLDRSVELDGRALKPKPRNVSEVIDGLKAGANIKIAEAPTWLGVEGLPEAKGFLVCRNGLVEFETGKLRKHDPRFFGINSVDFDFDPNRKSPEV